VDMDVPEAGPTKLTGIPIKLSDTPGAINTPPPSLGQHTDEILESHFGLDESACQLLRNEGII